MKCEIELAEGITMPICYGEDVTLNAPYNQDYVYQWTRNGNDIIGEIYTPLEYAPYVEYGTGLFAENGNGRSDVPWSYKDDEGNWHSTSGQHPHPYMRPALEENKEKIMRYVKEAFII